ncbi:phasin family protein [Pelagibius sp. Alg239-R121]|uniref:phasin family protein n=1 Tax=Pelagibius sp. Alg239-R121 TaxID=2993448 RepID=UPI0024A6212A|nr:phasin family protein [Pelagibius sp. Alg239-R121]
MAVKKTTASTTANEAIKPVEAAVSASKDVVESVVKAGSEAAAKGYEQAVAMTKEQVERTSSAVFQGYDEIATLGKDNIDAYVQSGNIVAKGFEDLSKAWMSFAQSSLDAQVAVSKQLLGVKTFREAVDMQTSFTKSSFDTAMAESAKLTELSVKVANEAMTPIQDRVNVMTDKLMKPVAA